MRQRDGPDLRRSLEHVNGSLRALDLGTVAFANQIGVLERSVLGVMGEALSYPYRVEFVERDVDDGGVAFFDELVRSGKAHSWDR